ncbi:hypothetical protein, partial [Alistipes shahii]|uniref:hypothetical protein n=2 Tax=Alistipes shahii TaxID=328814 RepID=UPI001E3DF1DC
LSVRGFIFGKDNTSRAENQTYLSLPLRRLCSEGEMPAGRKAGTGSGFTPGGHRGGRYEKMADRASSVRQKAGDGCETC